MKEGDEGGSGGRREEGTERREEEEGEILHQDSISALWCGRFSHTLAVQELSQ